MEKEVQKILNFSDLKYLYSIYVDDNNFYEKDDKSNKIKIYKHLTENEIENLNFQNDFIKNYIYSIKNNENYTITISGVDEKSIDTLYINTIYSELKNILYTFKLDNINFQNNFEFSGVSMDFYGNIQHICVAKEFNSNNIIEELTKYNFIEKEKATKISNLIKDDKYIIVFYIKTNGTIDLISINTNLKE